METTGIIGIIQGLYWGDIGIMEKNYRDYRDYIGGSIGVILG